MIWYLKSRKDFKMGQAKARKQEIAILKQSPKKPQYVEDVVSELNMYEIGMAQFMKEQMSIDLIPPFSPPNEVRIKQELSAPYQTPDLPVIRGSHFLTPGKGVPLNCWQNVKKHIQENPEDEMCVGVTCWQHKVSKQYKFETHVVVKHPDGSLEDVTAQLNPLDFEICFTPV